MATGALGALIGQRGAAVAGAGTWLMLSASFCARRLRGTSGRPAHVAEMALTSLLIPPTALFWRLAGAWRYRTLFF